MRYSKRNFSLTFGCIVLLQLLHPVLRSQSLQIETNALGPMRFEPTGWRIISARNQSQPSKQIEDSTKPTVAEFSTNYFNSTSYNRPNRAGRLVEWDDDELANDLVEPRGQGSNLLTEKQHLVEPRPRIFIENSLAQARAQVSRAPSLAGKSKLIYHGQIKQKSGLRKMVDGIEFYIDTHKPLLISRRSFNAQRADQLSPRVDELAEGPNQDGYSTTVKPAAAKALLGPQSNGPEGPSTSPMMDKALSTRPPASSQSQETSASSSDWRPIVIVSRGRRSGETQKNIRSEPIESSSSKNDTFSRLSIDYKWKPITKEPVERPVFDLSKRSKSMRMEPTEESPPAKVEAGLRRSLSSSVEEPFENEADSDRVQPSGSRGSLRDRGEASSSLSSDKWTPLETTTGSSALDLMPSSTAQPMTTTSPSVAAANETAQRSASDLNYIYSSQPLVQSTANVPQASGSYYSNYVMPPSVVGQPEGSLQPLVDTSSGQTPEMVAERVPEAPPVAGGGDYSVPPSVASFQPVQPPPGRVPVSSYYGNSGYDYYAPQSSLQGQPQRQSFQQPQAQPARSQAPAQQVVRQEHHYHYYNQPATGSPDRQIASSQPQFFQQPPAQQTVIRELQPIMISQPAIIQQASTTPTPQIIREIVKELPVQPIQMQRIILPQPIPIPIPTSPVRENFESPLGAYAPAQRIIRQLSSSMPQVAVKMPSISPLRLAMPSLQLPLRIGVSNPAPVTRQTGSFVIPPMPKKTTTFLTETQAMPSHTTIMQTTQFTPATRTTVYTTDHQTVANPADRLVGSSYRRRR